MVNNNNIKALKSGFWYTLANFTTKAMGFLTIPIFARLLSHEEFGLYSNYASWLQTFTVFVTLNLGATFISARFDFDKDFDSYVSSVLALSSLSVICWSFLIILFPNWFSFITGVDVRYIFVMMLYLLFSSAIEMFQTKERYYFRYKTASVISIVLAVSSSVLAVILVYCMDNKLTGRIVGFAIPYIIIGALLFVFIFMRGKKVNVDYWKYALPICLPFIPHLLSLTLLGSMNKIMITRFCGSEANALYSLAFSCGAAVTLLLTSMNTAFAPWLGEQLQAENLATIRNVAEKYVSAFAFFSCGIMLFVPEVLLIMGGVSYRQAIYIMPPVALGCVCQFIYTMYVNVEQFKKKTVGMAFASVTAACLNYVLNLIFIPKFGYMAAAYISFVSFAWLMIIHMYLVYKMGYSKTYDWHKNLIIVLFMSVYALLMHFLYGNDFLRYIAIVAYSALFVYIAIRYKSVIAMAFAKKKKG